jgi:hypothetical protein
VSENAATIRVTVVGTAGRVDLVVPPWMRVAELGRTYTETVGDEFAVVLATTTGSVLGDDRQFSQLGLEDGDLLVAVTGQEQYAGKRRAAVATGKPAFSGAWPASWSMGVYWITGMLALGAGVLCAMSVHGAARTACIALLMFCAFAAAVRLGIGPRAAEMPRAATAPAFAAAAGFAAAYSAGPGGVALGLGVGALVAAATAATARSFASDDEDELLVAWLATSAVVAVSAALILVLGATQQSLWALLLVAAIVVSRLLPYLVVDVPDQVLLDLDRLAITAWSAREAPRGSRRRRTIIKPEAVADLVHRGHRLVTAGVVAVMGTVSVAGPLLVLGARTDGFTGIGTGLMVMFGGAALALVSRSFRSRLPRIGLRLTGAWVLGFVAVDFLLSADETTTGALGGAAVALALLVVVSGVALGRGWRSIWWARVSDLVEGLCIVLAVAAFPVAAGLVTFARQLAS